MRNWMIKQLGGVPKKQYDALERMFMRKIAEWNETVEKHQLQSAWEQVKQERKARSVH